MLHGRQPQLVTIPKFEAAILSLVITSFILTVLLGKLNSFSVFYSLLDALSACFIVRRMVEDYFGVWHPVVRAAYRRVAAQAQQIRNFQAANNQYQFILPRPRDENNQLQWRFDELTGGNEDDLNSNDYQ